MFDCHGQAGNQEWALTKTNFVRHRDMCLALKDSAPGKPVAIEGCRDNDDKQLWEHTPQRTLRHKQSGLCLDSKDVKSGQHVTIDNCDSNKYSQIWQFSLNMNN